MNITEKILARASGKEKLEPGDVVFANVDKVMLHDVSGPGVIKTFEKLEEDGVLKVDNLFDPSMVWVAEDHFVPSAEKISAENISKLSKFTDKFGIKKHYKYGLGQYGICHTLSHEEGLVSQGELYLSEQVNRALHPKLKLEIDDFDIRLLTYLAKGLSQDEISLALRKKNITPNSLSTIEKRLNKLKLQFKANNVIHLVAITKDLGLI